MIGGQVDVHIAQAWQQVFTGGIDFRRLSSIRQFRAYGLNAAVFHQYILTGAHQRVLHRQEAGIAEEVGLRLMRSGYIRQNAADPGGLLTGDQLPGTAEWYQDEAANNEQEAHQQ
jgi:hypothetical protein